MGGTQRKGIGMSSDEDIRAAVKDIARDGRVACSDLLAIAERLGVEPARVGGACDELKIRISKCQLGCFG